MLRVYFLGNDAVIAMQPVRIYDGTNMSDATLLRTLTGGLGTPTTAPNSNDMVVLNSDIPALFGSLPQSTLDILSRPSMQGRVQHIQIGFDDESSDYPKAVLEIDGHKNCLTVYHVDLPKLITRVNIILGALSNEQV